MLMNQKLMRNIGLEAEISREILTYFVRYAVPLFALSSLVGILFLASPLFMLQVYDRVLGSGSMSTLGYLAAICIFCLGCMAVFDYLRARVLFHLAAAMYQRFAPRVLELSATQSAKSSRTTMVGLKELEVIRNVASGYAATTVLEAPIVPIFLVAVFGMSFELGLVVLLGGAALFCIALLSDRMSRRPADKSHADGTQSFEFAEDTIAAADFLVATGRLSAVASRYGQIINAQILKQLAAHRVHAFASSTSKLMRLMVQVAILGIGAMLVVRNDLTAGAMIACSIIAGRALAPIEQSIGAWQQLQSARQAMSALGQLEIFQSQARPDFLFPKPAGNLKLEGVSFRAANAPRPLFAGIDLRIDPGQLLAIVGESGAGKSTLCKLLTGLLPPTTGKVTIDDVALQHWSDPQAHGLVGYLPQTVRMLRGTVAQNISCFDESVSDDDVIAAAKLTGAHEMISALPLNYSTPIGTNGLQLSGGQAQMVGLTRALVRGPKLLVLDEPTAHLDFSARRRFGSFLKRCVLMQMTVVLVTHDRQLANACDFGLVLRRGGFELKKNDFQSISKLAFEDTRDQQYAS